MKRCPAGCIAHPANIATELVSANDSSFFAILVSLIGDRRPAIADCL